MDANLQNWIDCQPDPSETEVLNALIRELRMREDVYPGMIRTGKMKARTAAHEIKCIQAALKILKDQVAANSNQLKLGL